MTINQQKQNIKAFERLKQQIVTHKIAIERGEFVALENGSGKAKPGETRWAKTSERGEINRSIAIVKQQTATAALDELANEGAQTLVLVFASAHKPGGGVLNGKVAQEEDLARQTTWYFNAKDCKAYFQQEHPTALYNDTGVLVKNAYQVLDAYNQPLNNPRKISMLGVAAPNLNGLIKQKHTKHEQSVVYEIMANRIRGVLRLAEKHHYDRLILGAWGCGVFGLDPDKVSKLFQQALQEGIFTGQAIFPIPDQKTLEIFKTRLTTQDITQPTSINKPFSRG